MLYGLKNLHIETNDGESKCVEVACAWVSAMEATATLLLCAWCAVGKNFIVVIPLLI